MLLEILLLLISVITLLFLSFYFAGNLLAPGFQQCLLGSVCVRENCFQVELAQTRIQRDKGLMYREKLDKDKGMLFIFDKEGIYPFWMKDTLIPLDIIWIDGNNKIVFISHNVQPCKSLICSSIIPPGPAKYVLEINAGLAVENQIKIGDVADFKIKN